MDPTDIIDLTKEGTKPRDLIRLFKTKEYVPLDVQKINLNVSTECIPFPIEKPSPLDYNVVTTEGKMTVDRNNMVRYLRACRIIYDGPNAYMFNGFIYQRITDDDIARVIYKSMEAYDLPPFITISMVKDIIAMLRATSTVLDVNPPEGWNDSGDYDNEEELIPFDNGLYDVRADRMLRFTPYVYLTYQYPVLYDPKIREHPIEAVYKNIIPDNGTRRFFFEMVGYSLFCPKMAPPAIFVIYGPGNTGKSALQVAVTALAGAENISTMDLSQLSGVFTTVELLGKSINICGETGSGKTAVASKVDGELIKRLSDGQTITVQRKYGKPFQMANRAKLWFITNSLPDFGDTSSGLYRRIYIIPCRHEQNWEEQIYTKLSDWTAVSWLANKALQGYRDFLANDSKFHVSLEMLNELKSYKKQDALMDFFETHFGTSEKYLIPQKLHGMMQSDLYSAYSEYLATMGERKGLNKQQLTEKVRNEYSMDLVKVHTKQLDGKPTYRMKFMNPLIKKEKND